MIDTILISAGTALVTSLAVVGAAALVLKRIIERKMEEFNPMGEMMSGMMGGMEESAENDEPDILTEDWDDS